MSDVELKVVFVSIIVAVALVGGWPLFRRPELLRRTGPLVLGEALACGVFLGAGLIHLLFDAERDFTEAGVDFPWSSVICGSVILALLFLEHLGTTMTASKASGSAFLALLAAAVLSIHSLLVGAALGSSSEAAITVVIFIAVVAHKGAAAYALGIELMRSGLSRGLTVLSYGVFVAMFPLGAALGTLVGATQAAHPLWEPVFASLAAGTLLFLGTLHGLAANTLIARCQHRADFLFVVLGFAVMAVVAIWT